eukprot:scaffold1954_cov268-Pinguiococcus_pyrenoidosus.AAC.50
MSSRGASAELACLAEGQIGHGIRGNSSSFGPGSCEESFASLPSRGAILADVYAAGAAGVALSKAAS